ncbi:nucleotide-binding protein [Pseudosulfitobacter koreensis]|uniref:Nucleotide-binding protein n=1 Tax=Pseudosulfitobacter koreensis TaxID=2968472 RepID=A0ABT1YWI9_9RHOB|nr:nucleotide-binding protein [Pseudosulfitobacter koreense]MCR8825245.1 nucleotide-binding protein [Pseudosulfitobacter koreense]
MVNDPLRLLQRSCFVICPFGNQKGSEQEVEVWNEISRLDRTVFATAREVCKQAGYDVKLTDARGFDEGEAGTIRKRVVELIDTSDVVVMVMTNNKPNAYIELGWAMGLWRNPIILHELTCEPPSDINDMFRVPYDSLEIQKDESGDAVQSGKELAKAILNRLNTEPRLRPFETFKPTQLAHGKVDLLGRFQNISPMEWSQQFLDAREYITLASSNMRQILKQDFLDGNGKEIDLEELLLQRALDGVKVTILTRHPDNYSEDHLRRTNIREGPEPAIQDLEAAYRIWNTQRRTYDSIRKRGRLDLPPDGFRVVRMRKRYLPFRASMTEQSLFYTFRFYTQKYNSGLCIIARPDPHNTDEYNPPVFDQIRKELTYLIDQNEQSSEQDYRDWLEDAQSQQA